jgi:hypothetical protein
MRSSLVPLVGGLLFCAAIMGCKSTGFGTGESPHGNVKVNFTWEQSAPTSGTLRAVLTTSDGTNEMYEGKFYQITRDTTVETLGPLWSPWYAGWGGWAYWGPVPNESFVTHYTGHVVANLAGPNAERMRCQFQLNRSEEGMKGGGQGQCQLPSGKTINADFPAS